MNYHTSSRKIKRLKFLVKKLSLTKHYSNQYQRLIGKIQSLANDLRQRLSINQLKKVLGAAAMFITFSATNVEAQQFDPHVPNAFGMGVGNLSLVAPSIADLDGDGDLDLILGNYYGQIQYQRNSGSATNPVFDAPLNGPFGLVDLVNTEWYYSDLVDIDNDGDLDLMVGEYPDTTYAKFGIFENIGTPTNPNFSTAVVNPFNLTNSSYLATPSLVDIDGDGDLDLFSTSSSTVQFYENIGTPTNPDFAAPVNNPNGIFIPVDTYFYNVDAVDIDMDGDFDLLMNEYYGDFYYYQNTGTPTSPNFAAPAINPFNLLTAGGGQSYSYYNCIEAADMDGDGDYDLILGRYDDTNYEFIWYYENTMVISNNENKAAAIALTIFPNPTTAYLNLTADINEEVNIAVYDASGRLVLTEKNVRVDHEHTINIEKLLPGNYMLKLQSDQQFIVSKQFTVVKE